METRIFCRQVRVNPNTGYITLRLQSETTNGSAKWTGHLKDYGVDAELFHGRFGGDIEQLKTYLVTQHRTLIGRHNELVENLTKLEGQQIGDILNVGPLGRRQRRWLRQKLEKQNG